MTDNFNSELNFQATNFNNAPQQPAPVFDAFSGQPQQGYPPQGYVSFDQSTPPQPQYVNYDQTQPQPAWVPQGQPQPQPQQGEYSQFEAQGQPQQFGGEEHHHHEQHQQQAPPGPPRHFVACALMVIFKVAAVLCKFFISSENSTAEFIAVLSLSAVDFWVTKNICGRLLVGLRWWNEVKEDGTNEWIFESLEGKRAIHQSEALLFWGALGGNVILWIVLSVVNAFSFFSDFEYLIESILVAVMSVVNLVGYFKCARDASKRVKSMATSFMVNSAIDYVATGNKN